MDYIKNFWPLFWGINALHGPSGGGKQEVVNNELKIAEQNKIFAASISSGDEFRNFFAKISTVPEEQLSPEEKDLKRMNSGGYLKTLDLAMPSLVNLFADYFGRRLRGEGALLMVDGYLRVGGYRDPETKVWVPSQVDQVAEGMLRGLQIALKSGDLTASQIGQYMDQDLFEEIKNYQPTPYKDLKWNGLLATFANAVRNEIRHISIRIQDPDAECLMRFRSQKAMWKMFDVLEKRYEETEDLDLGSILNVLGEGILLQSGRFEIVDQTDVVLDPELSDRSLIGFPMNRDYAGLVDQKMAEIVKNGYRILGEQVDPKKSNLSTFVKALNLKYKVFDPQLVADLRGDDLSHNARLNRLEEFANKADKTMLQGELGIDLTKSTSEKQNVGILENGPDLGKTTYEQLQERAKQQAEEAYSYMLGIWQPIQEGQVVSGERRKV